MKQRGIELQHGGETYMLVEGGYNDDTRNVTLLARPDNLLFSHEPGQRPLTWRDQGDWYPIARQAMGFVTLQDARYEEQRPLIGEIVERYLDERVPGEDLAWALLGENGFAGSLEELLPMGLAVRLFDALEQAEAAEGARGIVPIQNLPCFLTHLAREGYAGAMWNDLLPVFFCIDEHGDLQFLRVRRDDEGRVEMEILDEQDGWERYEGAEEIEFLDNRDACDSRLVQVMGTQPVLGWPADGRLWSLGPEAGLPGTVTNEEDDLVYGVLFASEETARSWLEDVDEGWVAFPVDDVHAFLGHAELEGHGGLLNPGNHRACSGILWRDEERTVLDSFSGFWILTGNDFVPAP